MISIRGGVDLGTGETLEDITRANVDGIGYRKVGKRGRPFQVTTVVDRTSAGSAKSELEAYEALSGTLVSVVDDTGQTYSSIAVLAVRMSRPVQRVRTAVGGVSGGGYLLTCTWDLQATETS